MSIIITKKCYFMICLHKLFSGDCVRRFGYGFIIGMCMLIPGISGGSIAVILGIYDEILFATAELLRNTKKSIQILLPIIVGGMVGFAVMANGMDALLAFGGKSINYFFVGIILGGLILFCKKSFDPSRKINLFWLWAGIIVVVLIELIPADLSNLAAVSIWLRFLIYIIGGVLLAVALILPGISFSLMLVVLGVYDRFVSAIKEMDMLFLAPLATSVVFGIIVVSKTIALFLKKYPRQSHSLIVGFVLASLFDLLALPKNVGEGIGFMVLSMIGVAIPLLLVRFCIKNK